MERVTLGRMQNPVRGVLHGTAALAGMAGLMALLRRTPEAAETALAGVIFAASLTGMFTVSCLYHSVPWSPRWKTRMQRLDHAMIFLAVAGTYTPIGVAVLEGRWRSLSLAAVWAASLVGIILKFRLRDVNLRLSVTIQATLGAVTLIPMIGISSRFDLAALALAVVGSLAYTAGLVVFVRRRPDPIPHLFGFHETFHVLVVIGSASHFLLMLWYIVPYGG